VYQYKNKKEKMDLRSLNSGTVESKQWLNPVVGTVRANLVMAEESKTRDEETGTVFPNTATSYVYFTAGPTNNSVDVPRQLITTGRSSTSVPASAFVPLAQFEFFVAGWFQDTTPANTSSVAIGLTFRNSTTDWALADSFCDAILSSNQSTDTLQMFHVRSTFIITGSDSTSISGSFSTVSSINGTSNAVVVNSSATSPVNTPNRTTQPLFSPCLVVYSAGGPVTLRIYNWYLRRIA
jgi:hypothetical protein